MGDDLTLINAFPIPQMGACSSAKLVLPGYLKQASKPRANSDSKMGGYANSADLAWNSSSSNVNSRLGGSSSESSQMMTPIQVAVIMSAVGTFVGIIVMVFYCRTLQVRRNKDMKNREREKEEQERHQEEGEVGGGGGDTTGTESIELKECPSTTAMGSTTDHHSSDTKPLATSETMMMTTTSAAPDLEGGRGKAAKPPPIWKYIHWKDPYPNPVEPARPRHGAHGKLASVLSPLCPIQVVF
ncbi:hypothetical protein B0H63DRAFT_7998 [Podospora didyma]|uniref:Uncharacterized protein n=1 Tax=Podospora didyma TaxID=330526 RepID=A0AAE0P401_9PEZI|nr:hypothetical protein B0H63DRAFT_7998 [Podospora didyma]